MSIIIPFNQSLLPLKINLLINHHKTINNKINNIKKGIKILIHFPFIINPHLFVTSGIPAKSKVQRRAMTSNGIRRVPSFDAWKKSVEAAPWNMASIHHLNPPFRTTRWFLFLSDNWANHHPHHSFRKDYTYTFILCDKALNHFSSQCIIMVRGSV